MLYENVADDALFPKHFTDLDSLYWFRHANNSVKLGISVNISANSPAVATADLPQ